MAIDSWLTRTEPNAAGRMGLFRILFSMFYLWYLSFNVAATFSGLPPEHRHRVLLLLWLPAAIPSELLAILEAGLVAALVLLLAGYRTQVATLAVLLIGGFLEALRVSAKADHSGVFLTFYIPLFMLLCNAPWGGTYSVDALLRRRAGAPTVEPGDSGWSYFLPARASLLVLALLFLSAAAFKLLPGGTWLGHREFIANLVIKQNVAASIYGLPVNPLAPFIAATPIIYTAVRYQVLLFEALFVLGLFHPRLRSVFLAFALVFHACGALWLVITFTPILITYALFVDWQAFRQRLVPTRLGLLDAVSPRLLHWSTVLAAIAAGALWNHSALRSAVNLGGLVDWRTIWYPVLPLALIWLGRSLIELFRVVGERLVGGSLRVPTR